MQAQTLNPRTRVTEADRPLELGHHVYIASSRLARASQPTPLLKCVEVEDSKYCLKLKINTESLLKRVWWW